MAKGPKQKTHSASKKVINKRQSGSFSYKKSGGNHLTSKDSPKAIRQRRKQGTVSKGDLSRLKSVI